MTGKPTPPGGVLKIRSAPPDDPIYSRGYAIGGLGRNRLPHSSSRASTPAAPSSKGSPLQKALDQLNEELVESVPQQFGKTDA